MGKSGGGTSWLGLVKKAFRSPVKEKDTRSSRRREEAGQEDADEEEKKRGKRRWIFRKPTLHETTIHHTQQANTRSINTTNTSSSNSAANSLPENADLKQKQAIAVAMATTAAAEAAVATAQAAMDIIRLTRPALLVREEHAIITIQKAFRGYLARKALRALKGVVKLQALIRGHNVRKQARMTLQCMKSLVRVQAQVCDQRRRLSYDGVSCGSTFREPKSILELHLSDKESIGRNEASKVDDGDDHSQAIEKVEALLQKVKEAAKQRENTLAFAFSQKMWNSNNDEEASSNKELDEDYRVFHRADVKNYRTLRRASCHQTRDQIKNIEIDTACSYSDTDADFWRLQHQFYQDQQHKFYAVPSPLRRTHHYLPIHSPLTPSSKMKNIQVQSASPRYKREERRSHHRANMNGSSPAPNYMAATASARARERSQSAPRQMPPTPEREKSSAAKKRLSFPVPETLNGNIGSCDQPLDHRLMSPRWKSVPTEPFGTNA